MTTTTPTIEGAQVLTNSRIGTYSKCRRRAYYAYELGLRPQREHAALRTGTNFHAGLDLLAQGKPLDKVLAEVAAFYDVAPDYMTMHDWQCEREVVLRLLVGYHASWAADRWEFLATEQPFQVPIINPETGKPSTQFARGGVIDKIVRLRDGRIAIVEHKTKSGTLDPSDDYWRRLRFDNQISGYIEAARSMGYPVETIIYDVVRKPGLRPSQVPELDENGDKQVVDKDGQRVYNPNGKPRLSADAGKGYTMLKRLETPEEFGERVEADIAENQATYFARIEVARLDSDLDEYRHELWQTQKDYRQSQLTGRWYKNTSACLLGVRCPYFELCYANWKPTHNEAGALEIPEGYSQLTHMHPEIERVERMVEE